MGIERARVVEVHSPTSTTDRVGSGYLVTERLVLTAAGSIGRNATADVRPASTATWLSTSTVWSSASGEAVIVEVDDPDALMVPPGALRWGQVAGRRPLPVTAMGFEPVQGRPGPFRDAGQFFGHLMLGVTNPSAGNAPVEAAAISRIAGNGLHGAAVFAGAELVGLLLASAGTERLRAALVSGFAEDSAFVDLVGRAGHLELTPVRSAATGLSIL